MLNVDPAREGRLNIQHSAFNIREKMVGLGRFELPTSRLSGVRSNQLSYRPLKCVLIGKDLAGHIAAESFVRERGNRRGRFPEN